MDNAQALKRADELLMAFVASQDIPPGGTNQGTARSHGVKTGEFLIGIHETLLEYFRGVDDGSGAASRR